MSVLVIHRSTQVNVIFYAPLGLRWNVQRSKVLYTMHLMTDYSVQSTIREITIERFCGKHERKPKLVVCPHTVKWNPVQIVPDRSHFYTKQSMFIVRFCLKTNGTTQLNLIINRTLPVSKTVLHRHRKIFDITKFPGVHHTRSYAPIICQCTTPKGVWDSMA